MTVDAGDRRAAPRSGGWGGAAWRAAVVAVVAVLGFLVVPDRLLSFLATRLSPGPRDAAVVAWVTVVFLLTSWAFVALQGGRR